MFSSRAASDTLVFTVLKVLVFFSSISFFLVFVIIFFFSAVHAKFSIRLLFFSHRSNETSSWSRSASCACLTLGVWALDSYECVCVWRRIISRVHVWGHVCMYMWCVCVCVCVCLILVMLFVLLYPSSWFLCSVCMLFEFFTFIYFLYFLWVCVYGLRPLHLCVLCLLFCFSFQIHILWCLGLFMTSYADFAFCRPEMVFIRFQMADYVIMLSLYSSFSAKKVVLGCENPSPYNLRWGWHEASMYPARRIVLVQLRQGWQPHLIVKYMTL